MPWYSSFFETHSARREHEYNINTRCFGTYKVRAFTMSVVAIIFQLASFCLTEGVRFHGLDYNHSFADITMISVTLVFLLIALFGLFRGRSWALLPLMFLMCFDLTLISVLVLFNFALAFFPEVFGYAAWDDTANAMLHHSAVLRNALFANNLACIVIYLLVGVLELSILHPVLMMYRHLKYQKEAKNLEDGQILGESCA